MAKPTVVFRKMTENEFSQYIEASLEEYAAAIAKNYSQPIDETRTEANTQVRNLLKEGQNTKGHHLFVALDKATMREVGNLWIHIDEKKRTAFIYDIRVSKPFRGKGYGKAILKALEPFVKSMKSSSIALHVFADNSVALGLYKKLGYTMASYNMKKKL